MPEIRAEVEWSGTVTGDAGAATTHTVDIATELPDAPDGDGIVWVLAWVTADGAYPAIVLPTTSADVPSNGLDPIGEWALHLVALSGVDVTEATLGLPGAGAVWSTQGPSSGTLSIQPTDPPDFGIFDPDRLTVLIAFSDVGIPAGGTGWIDTVTFDDTYGAYAVYVVAGFGIDAAPTVTGVGDGGMGGVQIIGLEGEGLPEEELDAGRRYLIWRDADGTEHPLLFGAGTPAARQIRTAGLPPAQITATERPFGAGEVVQGARWQAREVAVPVRFLNDVEARVDQLAEALDPTRGDGTLIQVRHDGTRRHLPCRYSGGLQVTENTWLDESWASVLIFRAASPFWRSPTLNQRLGGWSDGDAVPFFPFFPFRLGVTAGLAGLSCTNSGPVESPPTWRFTGPFSSVRVTNTTTGYWFAVDAAADVGEVIEVDVDAGTITRGAVNLLPQLRSGSTLFHLAPGPNVIEVLATNGEGSTTSEVTWPTLWLSA